MKNLFARLGPVLRICKRVNFANSASVLATLSTSSIFLTSPRTQTPFGLCPRSHTRVTTEVKTSVEDQSIFVLWIFFYWGPSRHNAACCGDFFIGAQAGTTPPVGVLVFLPRRGRTWTARPCSPGRAGRRRRVRRNGTRRGSVPGGKT